MAAMISYVFEVYSGIFSLYPALTMLTTGITMDEADPWNVTGLTQG